MTATTLPLENAHERHYALPLEVAACYHQAARVCLDRHHTSPVEFRIEDDTGSVPVEVKWDTTDARSRAAWANRDDATRDGGYLCVIAAAEVRDDLYAIRRVQVGGRADYYVGPRDTLPDDMESCFRLEISGIDSGYRTAVIRRLGIKVAQVSGGGTFPAMAGVIGFAAGLIVLRWVDDPLEVAA